MLRNIMSCHSKWLIVQKFKYLPTTNVVKLPPVTLYNPGKASRFAEKF